MASFDIYTYKYTESEHFFRKSVEKEKKVWLDGIDGFYDQYFSRLQGIGKEDIRFVPIESPTAIPSDIAQLENLSVIDAQIIESHEFRAQVLIKDVQTLGHWARATDLPKYETVSSIPQNFHIPKGLSTELMEKVKVSGNALWKSDIRYWKKPSEVSAIYVFSHNECLRCLILTTNAVPSYLVFME